MASSGAELHAEQHRPKGGGQLAEHGRHLAILAAHLCQRGGGGCGLGFDHGFDLWSPGIELGQRPSALAHRGQTVGGDRLAGELSHVTRCDIGDLFESDPLKGVRVGIGLLAGRHAEGQGLGRLEPGASTGLAGEHLEQVAQQAAIKGVGLIHRSSILR